jgi:hypothetical protein
MMPCLKPHSNIEEMVLGLVSDPQPTSPFSRLSEPA